MNSNAKTQNPSPAVLRLLFGLSLAESLLSVFQWAELVVLRRGGNTVCSINETFNCETVWNSRFASVIHDALGMPVAGLGLVWGLAASFVAGRLLLRSGKSQAQSAPALLPALRFFGVIGATSCLGFGAASAMTKSLCVTCLGTYALVLLFAGVAVLRLPGPFMPSAEQMPRALMWTVGPALGAYVLLLAPGMLTPHALEASGQTLASKVAQQPTVEEGQRSPLAHFLASLSPEETQALSEGLQRYRRGPTAAAPPPNSPHPRVRKGEAKAPVQIVEFTDIRCGHCRALVEAMKGLEQVIPQEKYMLEARHFPLDSECNPVVPPQFSDHTQLRCTGAKAQICLEDQPDYWTLRDQLFSEQESLTPARILEIAASGKLSRAELESCMKSPETDKKLQEDIRYAQQVKPSGTPIVLVNGRSALPLPALLYALVLSGGNVDAPEFSVLPPPSKLVQAPRE